MKLRSYLKAIISFLIYLIISLPIIYAQEVNYVLDKNGNLISGDNYFREYDDFNQLFRIREGNFSTGKVLEEYVWHPVEEKIIVKRVFYNNTLNYTIYYFDENYILVKNSSGTFKEKYIMQDGILVAQVNSDGQKLAVHSDHEGSVNLVTDSQGNVIDNVTYSVTGEIISGGKVSRFDYEGKEYDPVVGDYDFHFRKFKPEIYLFAQPDSLIKNVYDPQSLNRFAFERNNPQINSDPTGHFFWIGILIIGAAIYSGFVLANQLTTIEKSQGKLSGFDTTMAFLNIGLIAFPGNGIGQFVLKFGGKQGYKGYFDKRIDDLKEKELEEKKELKCSILLCPQKLENPYAIDTTEEADVSDSIKPPTTIDSSSNSQAIPVPQQSGPVSLGPGGSSGGATCYVSCTITPGPNKPYQPPPCRAESGSSCPN